MTKIAHLERKREQDSAVAERNDEKLTRVARATAKAGADVARESVQVAQSATEALAQRTPTPLKTFTRRRASWRRNRPSLAAPSRSSSGSRPARAWTPSVPSLGP